MVFKTIKKNISKFETWKKAYLRRAWFQDSWWLHFSLISKKKKKKKKKKGRDGFRQSIEEKSCLFILKSQCKRRVLFHLTFFFQVWISTDFSNVIKSLNSHVTACNQSMSTHLILSHFNNYVSATMKLAWQTIVSEFDYH